MIFSDHFKRTIKIIGTIALLLLLGYLWLVHHIRDVVLAPRMPLPSSEIERIQVNPDTHQLIISTPTGTKTVTLPDRTSTIDVMRNGSVKVTSPQLGLEHHLFVGLLGSDNLRIAVGMDAFYWKRLDLGIGIADQLGMHPPIAFAKLTYNVKGNLQAGVVYQSNQYVGGILSVRVF